MVIVGTTDTDYDGDPALVHADPEDVDYLLKVVDQYFPGVRITRQDIVGTYAGVRPLIDDGASSEGKTSREHAIWTDPSGVTFVAGGKYTTYRNMAEQTVDHVLNQLSIEERVKYGHSQTLTPLNPIVTEALLARAVGEHLRWSDELSLSSSVTAELAERHGLEAEQIIAEALPLRARVPNDEEWMWCAEALHAVRNTMCLRLADFYFRRTHLILMRTDHGMPFAKSIAQTMGEVLDWDAREQQAQINALQNQLSWELSATIDG
jgi:glycerol-3-phosphate dehydrogenase